MNVRALIISVTLVAPCFWLPRLVAGDLGSHTYNVWLVQLIRAGQAPGLWIERIYTNVLFDVWMERLVGLLGWELGERLAVATAVLTLFWGAWQWVRRTTHASPAPVGPLLAMFAYGWVFHVGFFNFYWSLGFCFWALAMSEWSDPRVRRWWWAPLVPAVAAHVLPVAWAGALWAYGQVLRRAPGRRRMLLLGAGVVALAAASAIVRMLYVTLWSGQQTLATIGFDQLWLLDMRYFAVATAYLAIWGLGLLFVLYAEAPGRLGQRRAVHYAVLTAAAGGLVPWVINLPWFSGPLSFITQRMSLAVAVLLCGLLPLSRRAGKLMYPAMAVAAVYFGMLYVDFREIGAVEEALARAVRTVPAGARVAAHIDLDAGRLYPYLHMVDKACIGHCYSYGNYEASTTQFRVRARTGNGIVAADVPSSLALQTGRYTVKDGEAPIYFFLWVDGKFVMRELRAGEKM